jgi:head-tail adaptor
MPIILPPDPVVAEPPILDARLINQLRRRFNCDFIIQKPQDASAARTWLGWSSGLVATTSADHALGTIQSLTAIEREATGAIGTNSTHMLFIAFVAGILPTMRVLYGTRVFNIHGTTDYGEQHLLLQLDVEERFRK